MPLRRLTTSRPPAPKIRSANDPQGLLPRFEAPHDDAGRSHHGSNIPAVKASAHDAVARDDFDRKLAGRDTLALVVGLTIGAALISIECEQSQLIPIRAVVLGKPVRCLASRLGKREEIRFEDRSRGEASVVPRSVAERAGRGDRIP